MEFWKCLILIQFWTYGEGWAVYNAELNGEIFALYITSYVGVDVLSHAFLTSALDGRQCNFHFLDALLMGKAPEIHWIEGWMGHR